MIYITVEEDNISSELQMVTCGPFVDLCPFVDLSQNDPYCDL